MVGKKVGITSSVGVDVGMCAVKSILGESVGIGETVGVTSTTGVCVAAGVATGTGSVSVNNRGAIGIWAPHADNAMTKVIEIESFSTFENTSLLQSQNKAF